VKKLVIVFMAGLVAPTLRAQKVDSIFFHLYTDSLKKGTHNYINVDGKLRDGGWLPLTSKEIVFSSSACEFSGNDLIIPMDFADEKITVKAQLRNNPSSLIERTIWIKRKPDPEILPTKEDVMRDGNGKKRRR
jgi:hypothetical protein